MGGADSKNVSVSHREGVLVLDLDWSLGDFEKLTSNAVGYFVTKDVSAPVEPKHDFSLCLYPCGFNERTKNYVAVCLKKKSDAEVAARFTCSIVYGADRELCRRSSKQTLAFESVVGWTTFCKRSLLLDKKVSCSNPTLNCKIEVFQSVLTMDENDDSSSLQEMSGDFQRLLDGGFFSDFSLKVEGVHIKVHRSVLSARSPVFKAMFNSPLQNKQKSACITDVSYGAMMILVKFVYTGRLDFVDVPNAMEVYYASDKYEVSFLRDACSKVLANNLLPDNVIQVLLLAYQHSDNDLQEECLSFMDKNLRDIKGREEWIELMKNHPKLADRALFFQENSGDSSQTKKQRVNSTLL